MMKYLLAILGLAIVAVPQQALAAIGCTLSNPAEDLKYLFPELTTFKEELNEFPKLKNGAELFKGLRARLGSDLDPIYERYETPYTVYSVYKGQTKIGIVHGVNVPGKGGVIQVFLSTDPATGQIRSFFYQRLESPAARQLRSKEFRAQFSGLDLGDFYKHDYYTATNSKAKADKIGAIKPPPLDSSGQPDYEASLRGIRKNLILLDIFVYGRRFEPFFERARQATEKGKTAQD
jgi:hypothetical protein